MTTVLPRTAEASFQAIGTTVHLVSTEPEVIDEARAMTERHLRELDAAASRFRSDSEVRRLAARAAEGEASTFVSPVLAGYLSAALHAARITDGLVDPTVGATLVASGYDADIELVRQRTSFAPDLLASVPGWRSVRFDEVTRHVTVPRGTLLDLGASAKAHAADLIAAALASALPGGFLVNLGGDIATGGRLPEGGWPIGVEDVEGRVVQAVLATGQAFATSSTRHRVWATREGARHHIIDPRTGLTAPAVWAQVTCAATTALEANAASTAAIVLGDEAPGWLATQGIPARLDRSDGTTRTTPGWPGVAGARS